MSYGEESQPAQYANPVAMQNQGVQIKYEHDANNSSATGLGASSSATGGSGHETTMYHSGYETYGKLIKYLAIHFLVISVGVFVVVAGMTMASIARTAMNKTDKRAVTPMASTSSIQ